MGPSPNVTRAPATGIEQTTAIVSELLVELRQHMTAAEFQAFVAMIAMMIQRETRRVRKLPA